MRSDIEIAQSCTLQPISRVAEKLGLMEEHLEHYGRYIAKLRLPPDLMGRKRGKLILVTAINPTKAGEGKTTTSIGLADALNRMGKKAVLALREPSLGPVFGLKGGAAGGGYSQIVPMEDINLHFTGDFHAIGAANNLLAAMVDNHIYQGNELRIDRVVWRRCVDMNDRQLRALLTGVGGGINGVPRSEHFDITVATETMAVFCMAEDLADLKERLGRMIVGYTRSGEPVTAHDLKAEGAMTALLKQAMLPNLVQTLEGTPAIVHGGPFANIAHGCNSVAATRAALHLGEYCITEAGFGADLGAEKFLDIKCRAAGLVPDAAVLVATVRALKLHGGASGDLSREDMDALKKGLPNLLHHIRTLRTVYGLPVVVALNQFAGDTEAEIELVENACREYGTPVALSQVWEKGGAGGLAVAEKVVQLVGENVAKTDGFRFAYALELPLTEKLRAVTKQVYGGADVALTRQAEEELQELERLGFGGLPVCIAKTQYSLSDDPEKLGAPQNFTITIRSLRVCAGAGFVVAMAGDILTMPGLPKHPAAEKIDVTQQGDIVGLF
mgnify:FL=1